MKRLTCGYMVVCLLLCGAALDGVAAGEEALPEGLRGFSGQVRGVVVAKGERNTFTFKVFRVIKVWEGNKAKTPEAIVERTIPVGPRWLKGDGNRWHPSEVHVRFIGSLETGAEITLEVHNVEHHHFAILELSEEQRGVRREKETEERERRSERASVDREPSREGREGERDGRREQAADERRRQGSQEARIRELEEVVEKLRDEVAELRALMRARR